MDENDNLDIWRAKLAAWLHDPPEKALVLMRGKGHEAGTVATLLHEVFGVDGLPQDLEALVRKADHWASAADRPSRPKGESRYPAWDRVSFPSRPVLRHPVSGQKYDLGSLEELDPSTLEETATSFFRSLLVRDGSTTDFRTSFFRLWRLGPELGTLRGEAKDLQHLWRLLPADTRVPDHSIWEHLGLVSAFASCFAAGDAPALMSVSLGPVQAFIEQARSTSDLWAGSHLLSAMSWEAMKVVCERLGPDAVVFPSLRGVPIVDAWLQQAGHLDFGDDLLAKLKLEWRRRSSDSNPLFAATLPNRFVAIVPERQAEDLAHAIEQSVRGWVRERATDAWAEIAEIAGLDGQAPYALTSIGEQLAGFPEVHWAAASWRLVGENPCDPGALRRALETFHGEGHGGFLEGPAWRLLSQGLHIEHQGEPVELWSPNPGALYPAIHDLAERALAAAKAARTFTPLEQKGYRCSLCGERSWLCATADAQEIGRNQQHRADPWPAVATRSEALARKGEHLCTLCTLKRVWPRLFVRSVGDILAEDDKHLRRYVVSTHAMALVPSLQRLLEIDDRDRLAPLEEALSELDEGQETRGVALPRAFAEDLRAAPRERVELIRRLPAVLEALGDRRRDSDGHARNVVETRLERIQSALKHALGSREEAYYALLLVDGDDMGKWLSSFPGSDASSPGRPTYGGVWHPEVENEARQRYPSLGAYLDARAPASAAYHAALSSVLNGLASEVFPTMVEEAFRGKVLYAGGDDLLAMAPVEDVLRMMLAIRCAYSGTFPKRDQDLAWELLALGSDYRIDGGYLQRHGRRSPLLRTMGNKATCSMGVVIAHHMTPLGAVLRDLRTAEKRAKQSGKNAFSITLAKRAGGTTHLTCNWGFGGSDAEELAATPMGVLVRMQEALAGKRRAAYRVQAWLENMPPGPWSDDERDYRAMVASTFYHQLCRGAEAPREQREQWRQLADDAAGVALAEAQRQREKWRKESGEPEPSPSRILSDLIGHAEFLARDERSSDSNPVVTQEATR